MKILSLFDGISVGRLALERAGIKVDKYYASEINPYSIQVAQKNWPDIIEIGDVRNVDGTKYRDCDMVIGGSPCFEAGTKVITKNGYKNIEEIKVGDEVLTHTRQYQKVLRTGGKVAETVELHCQGMLPTRVTLNHPYYVKHMTRKGRDRHRELSQPEWVAVKDLKKDDFIGLPIIETEENPYNLTEEDCWLLGRYVADGHYRKNKRKERIDSYQYQMILSIGNDKLENFKKHIITKHYSCYTHSQSVYRCVFYSEWLVNFLIDNKFGKGAENKRIPEVILNLPVQLANQFLEGYMSGDGYYVEDKDYHGANTISKDLALGLTLLIAKCKNVNCNIHYYMPNPTTVIEGRIVNQQPTYTLQFRDKLKLQSHAIVEDGFIWMRFIDYTDLQENRAVYNLEVENDNSYTANNIVVHNCQNFSFAGKRNGASTVENIEIVTLDQYLELKNKGFEFDGYSYLFWEYVRVLKEVQPKYFLLENVRMSKKWEDVISNTLGVKPIKINSALVSAQTRNRLYWTNIEGISQPKDKGIFLGDILKDTYSEKEVLSEFIQNRFRLTPNVKTSIGTTKPDFRTRGDRDIVYGDRNKMGCLLASDYKQPKQVYHNGVLRKISPEEAEILQTLPEGYTSGISYKNRWEAIGNCWTVDCIVELFRPLIRQNDLMEVC